MLGPQAYSETRGGAYNQPTADKVGLGCIVWQGCHRPVVAGGPQQETRDIVAVLVIPEPAGIDEAVPEPARRYLQQAQEALHAPDGATMLAASAVDALLKAKGYTKGWLNDRINQAAADHVSRRTWRSGRTTFGWRPMTRGMPTRSTARNT
jgi:hypothetical protein